MTTTTASRLVLHMPRRVLNKGERIVATGNDPFHLAHVLTSHYVGNDSDRVWVIFKGHVFWASSKHAYRHYSHGAWQPCRINHILFDLREQADFCDSDAAWQPRAELQFAHQRELPNFSNPNRAWQPHRYEGIPIHSLQQIELSFANGAGSAGRICHRCQIAYELIHCSHSYATWFPR